MLRVEKLTKVAQIVKMEQIGVVMNKNNTVTINTVNIIVNFVMLRRCGIYSTLGSHLISKAGLVLGDDDVTQKLGEVLVGMYNNQRNIPEKLGVFVYKKIEIVDIMSSLKAINCYVWSTSDVNKESLNIYMALVYFNRNLIQEVIENQPSYITAEWN